MANKTKQNLRLRKVHERQLKTSYAHLMAAEKRYIKLVEQEAELEKSVATQWRIINDKQAPPYLPHNTPPDVQEMIDLVLSLEDRLGKVIAAKDRHIAKHSISEGKIKGSHMLTNLHPISF